MMKKHGLLPFLLLAALIAGVRGAPETQKMMSEQRSTITLGGGCFWCIEAIYTRMEGVEKAVSGYAGGHVPNPSYEAVTTGRTGHAEVVQVHYDPTVVSLDTLLELFWRAHDPTTKDRQGADVGTQYRSIILYADETQKAAAEKSKQAAQANFRSPIVTEIVPLKEFHEAEDYHQNYYERNPAAGYCTFVIRPKLKKLGM